jgi:hypothetical protein
MRFRIEYSKTDNFRLVAVSDDGTNVVNGEWVGIGGIAFVDLPNPFGTIQRMYAQSDRHAGGILPCERPFAIFVYDKPEIVGKPADNVNRRGDDHGVS